MKANVRALLTACIDTGISFGWNRAHKHTDEPNEHRIQEEIENAIWHEIDQYFVFDSERDLCDEVAEGFDHLEQEEVNRLRAKKKQIYEDLKDAVDREWVGLTDEEIACLWGHSWYGNAEFVKHFGRKLEAKLKEKNT